MKIGFWNPQRVLRFLFIVFFILLFSHVSLFAQQIKIGIYYKYNVFSAAVAVNEGNYILYAPDSVIKLDTSGNIKISLVNNQIRVQQGSELIGSYNKISLSGKDFYNSLKIKILNPSLPGRIYDDNIHVVIRNNKLQFINEVDMDRYVAGVVEAESGRKAQIEYYKTQAVICRTYALEKFYRHYDEGFNLCDDVHCQVFKGHGYQHPEIIEATLLTSGLIIIDTNMNLITANFHSSCGGQTADVKNVWQKPMLHLKSVSDTFCIREESVFWEKQIAKNAWIQYLKRYGFRNASADVDLTYLQPYRKAYYILGDDSIILTKIRTDWNLRSTFFSIYPDGEYIIMKGRGYGHGVGLCQIGAMKMAEEGYKFSEIIQHYYQNTYIVPLKAWQFFKEY